MLLFSSTYGDLKIIMAADDLHIKPLEIFRNAEGQRVKIIHFRINPFITNLFLIF